MHQRQGRERERERELSDYPSYARTSRRGYYNDSPDEDLSRLFEDLVVESDESEWDASRQSSPGRRAPPPSTASGRQTHERERSRTRYRR